MVLFKMLNIVYFHRKRSSCIPILNSIDSPFLLLCYSMFNDLESQCVKGQLLESRCTLQSVTQRALEPLLFFLLGVPLYYIKFECLFLNCFPSNRPMFIMLLNLMVRNWQSRFIKLWFLFPAIMVWTFVTSQELVI